MFCWKEWTKITTRRMNSNEHQVRMFLFMFCESKKRRRNLFFFFLFNSYFTHILYRKTRNTHAHRRSQNKRAIIECCCSTALHCLPFLLHVFSFVSIPNSLSLFLSSTLRAWFCCCCCVYLYENLLHKNLCCSF